MLNFIMKTRTGEIQAKSQGFKIGVMEKNYLSLKCWTAAEDFGLQHFYTNPH